MSCLTQPLVLGHEFVGVIETGERTDERVALDPAIPCGRCGPCIAGDENLCVACRFAGNSIDGALALATGLAGTPRPSPARLASRRGGVAARATRSRTARARPRPRASGDDGGRVRLRPDRSPARPTASACGRGRARGNRSAPAPHRRRGGTRCDRGRGDAAGRRGDPAFVGRRWRRRRLRGGRRGRRDRDCDRHAATGRPARSRGHSDGRPLELHRVDRAPQGTHDLPLPPDEGERPSACDRARREGPHRVELTRQRAVSADRMDPRRSPA